MAKNIKYRYVVGGLSINSSPEEQQKTLNELGEKGYEVFSVVQMMRGKHADYLMFYARKAIVST